jgi:hypothetical protein
MVNVKTVKWKTSQCENWAVVGNISKIRVIKLVSHNIY